MMTMSFKERTWQTSSVPHLEPIQLKEVQDLTISITQQLMVQLLFALMEFLRGVML